MKNNFLKCRIFLLAAILMWCILPEGVYAEENQSHCYPSEEQIAAYKKDGTWEKRQEYVKKLGYATPSQELLYNAIQREYGFAGYAAGDNIPENWKGMQVEGDAKMLLVRVEFADVKFEDSKIYSEEAFYNMVMGDESTGIFPHESLNAYYERSSYGKLNITSDQVYSCTVSKNRDAYEWADEGEQELLMEVFEMLDESVDFTDYDANHDGRIDGVCINFAGENTGWGSTWWSHKYDFLDSGIMYDGVTPAGYIFLETYLEDETYGTQTLIHETGHMLGLPDYYSQNSDGIGTTDMMNNNIGDHNGFSKWLLGWIEEENILRISREDGAAEVELSPLSCEVPGDKKLIAVIAPEDTSVYSEYFIVQYDEHRGNQSVSDIMDPRYRIYHVNANLNEEETDFAHDNLYAYDGKYLIKAVSIENEYGWKRDYYVEGDALTPDTNESSAFYGGNVLGFTGIELTDFKTGEVPSFHVSFREKEVVDGKLELQIVSGTPLNMAELMLMSNKPLINAYSMQQAYLEDSDGKQYPVELSVTDGTYLIKTSYIAIADSLKTETEYTLVIPEGMFQIDTDVYSEECRFAIKTGIFPTVEVSFGHGLWSSTNVFNIDETKAGIIEYIDFDEENWITELHVYEGTEKANVVDVHFPIPQPYDQLMEMNAVACYDGTIAVEISSADPIDYSTSYNYYKIDQAGKVLAGPYSVFCNLDIFPAGNGIKGVPENSGALGAPDIENELKLEIYTVDFQNEPTSKLINCNRYMSNVYPLDKDSYMAIWNTDDGNIACIFNNKDELIKEINLDPYVDGSVCAAVHAGDSIAIMYVTFLDEGYSVSISKFDMEGSHLGTYDIMTLEDWKSIDGWKLEKTAWGYSLSNYTTDSPMMFYLLNDECAMISSMQVPDMICSGTHMGSRIAVKWYDLSVLEYRVAITEPIVDEKEEEIVPEPDKPSVEEDSEDKVTPENGAVPNTGDTNNLIVLFTTLILSVGIIIESKKRA